MNKVVLLGKIVKEIEMRYTQSNLAIARFPLAVRREAKNKEGKYESDFLNCIAYSTLAETIQKYFHKDSRILIEGHIQTGSYENAKKEKVYTTDIVVEKINFVDKIEKVEKQIQMDTIQNDNGTTFEMPF